MALNVPPLQTPIYNGASMAPAWASWFENVWRALTSKTVVLPVANAGVTPDGITGQVYLTSTGILATYNGTSWVKYDGTAVVF